jgi:homoserine O-acetyltransferase/O-succinyltransferase
MRRLRWLTGGACMALAAACAHPPPDGAPSAAHALLLEPARAIAGEHAPERFVVRFETSQGPVLMEVVRAWAPRGADRFHTLVRLGFFDQQRFFRVRAKFIAQFGLHPEPAVIAAWKPMRLTDDPPATSNLRGTVAYAFTGPDTRSTQVFISLSDNTQLDAQGFAPFGRVIEGMDVVDRLYAEYDERAGGGMRAGKQRPIEAEGNVWLAREFPRLDYIKSARIVQVSSR